MKRLRVILLFLLLGAVVNVVVAWGISASSHVSKCLTHSFLFDEESNMLWDHYVLARLGIEGQGVWGINMNTTGRRETRIKAKIQTEFVPVFEEIHRTGNSLFPTEVLRWEEHDVKAELIINDYGWPVQGLRSVCYSRPQAFWYGVVHWSNDQMRMPLPLLPLWNGLLLNTILYASLLWLLIPGPFVLRRFIRRKRGLCVKCAYDLRGAEHEACPECGTAVRIKLKVEQKMMAGEVG